MKRRNERLIPLTHDHHHVLAMVRRTRADLSAEARVSKALDELVEFYETEMISHFREEEEQIFPLLVDAQGHIPDELAKAMTQHLHVHALVKQLKRLPSRSALEELLNLIDNHVRLEEKKLFPLIEEKEPLKLQMVELAPRDRSAAGRASR
jgi:iron-sulfur cluster repair protein YtfE (RIC family)